jgi:exopolyphosphatase/guanosine-5'-triphosphate,3'-diphosphate pyrophosphatase
MSERVAAIDIGTNSVLLLVAERRGQDVVALTDRATITRLGRGVDATRTLAPEAVERTLACLASYATEARSLGVTRFDVVGTSAMRDAHGGEEFRARATEILGTAPRTIPGAEEARLTFLGALAGTNAPKSALVIDIGGGSTEIVASNNGEISGVSVDVGAVRMTERFVRSDPPTASELGSVREAARAAFSTTLLASRPAALVAVAGTATTIAAHVLDVVPYDGAKIHGATLTRSALRTALDELARMSLAERRQARAIEPARADVIVAGAEILDVALEVAQASELIVSDRGVRWGLALGLLG